ncbi:MAG: hypothetical protein ACKVOJ_02245 [Sphingomonadaceae bacterium]
MRSKFLVLPLLIAVSACSQNPDQDDKSTQQETLDVAEESMVKVSPPAAEAASRLATGAPEISTNVTPGVAFRYAYNFALPETNIARVQGEHAAACERLGIIHCRVTGMTFRKPAGQALEAQISFKLDPAMANSFARSATDIVARADGSLASSDVNGNDAGSNIVAADRSAAALRVDLAKIDAQLKIPGLSRDVRSRLVEEANSIRAELQSVSSQRDKDVESLATTPVSFTYADNAAILGFDSTSPVQQALRTSGYSFTAMFSFVTLAIGVLAPWALLAFGAFWLVRQLRKRLVKTPVQD